MRVVNSSAYRKFTSSVNDVHSKLNKSMNKVSSGKAYENAAENPLAYYEGKKIDNQYQDTLSKSALITNLKSRVDLQSSGAHSIQTTLSEAKTKLQYILSDSNNGTEQTVSTIRDDLLQKQQSMVNTLNAQYQNFYVYGGNDISTAPFSLSADGRTLTFTHKFPGDSAPTEMRMTLTANGYTYEGTDAKGNALKEDKTLGKMLDAMREQGRVDVGYGSISDRDTLLDTYTGGLNLLTGLNSDAMNALANTDPDKAIAQIKERMDNSPIGLIGKAVIASDEFLADFDNPDKKAAFTDTLRTVLDDMTVTEHTVSTVYSDLGNKYSLLEDLDDKLNLTKDSLSAQYKDKLGADPYEAIMEMYSYQYSYNASLQVGSKLMQSSLFDFMR